MNDNLETDWEFDIQQELDEYNWLRECNTETLQKILRLIQNTRIIRKIGEILEERENK